MSAFNFTPTHKNNIKSGDTILHNGEEVTLSKSNFSYCSFMGLLIKGDSYNLGYNPVLKGKLKNENNRND